MLFIKPPEYGLFPGFRERSGRVQVTGDGLGRKKGDSASWLHPLPYTDGKKRHS